MTIIERSSDFIGFATMDGTPQYINPVGHKLVGLAVGEAISHLRIFDVLAAHDRRRALEMLLPIVLSTGRWIGDSISVISRLEKPFHSWSIGSVSTIRVLAGQ